MRTLTYHDVVPAARDARRSAFRGRSRRATSSSPTAFEAHLDALQATGLEVRPARRRDGAAPELTLTFDDGGSSAMDIADALERRDWRGQFFITTARLGSPGIPRPASRCASWPSEAISSAAIPTPTRPTWDDCPTCSSSAVDAQPRDARRRSSARRRAPPRCPAAILSRAVIDAAADAGYRAAVHLRAHGARALREARRARALHDLGHDAGIDGGRLRARRARWPAGRLWLEWNAKKLAKHMSPSSIRRCVTCGPDAPDRSRRASQEGDDALRAASRVSSRARARPGLDQLLARSSRVGDPLELRAAAAAASPGATSSAAPAAAAGTPPTAVATAGRPVAKASWSTCGKPSVQETCRKAWLLAVEVEQAAVDRHVAAQLHAVLDARARPAAPAGAALRHPRRRPPSASGAAGRPDGP